VYIVGVHRRRAHVGSNKMFARRPPPPPAVWRGVVRFWVFGREVGDVAGPACRDFADAVAWARARAAAERADMVRGEAIDFAIEMLGLEADVN